MGEGHDRCQCLKQPILYRNRVLPIYHKAVIVPALIAPCVCPCPEGIASCSRDMHSVMPDLQKVIKIKHVKKK